MNLLAIRFTPQIIGVFFYTLENGNKKDAGDASRAICCDTPNLFFVGRRLRKFRVAFYFFRASAVRYWVLVLG